MLFVHRIDPLCKN